MVHLLLGSMRLPPQTNTHALLYTFTKWFGSQSQPLHALNQLSVSKQNLPLSSLVAMISLSMSFYDAWKLFFHPDTSAIQTENHVVVGKFQLFICVHKLWFSTDAKYNQVISCLFIESKHHGTLKCPYCSSIPLVNRSWGEFLKIGRSSSDCLSLMLFTSV